MHVGDGETNLVETDVRGLLTEALTADVHLYTSQLAIIPAPPIFSHRVDFNGYPYPILADQTGAVGADTAVLFQHNESAHNFLSHFRICPPFDSFLLSSPKLPPNSTHHLFGKKSQNTHQEREPLPNLCITDQLATTSTKFHRRGFQLTCGAGCTKRTRESS